MYCSGCGSKLVEDAEFCVVCGTKVEVESIQSGEYSDVADYSSGSVISAKKRKKGAVIAVSIAVVCLILGILAISFVAFGGIDKIRVARLCDLGDRYLSELEYEQAIAAYEAAIEIEPRAEEAYIGLADAYIGLGDYESALEALDRGIVETNSERLKDYCADVQKEWDDRERRNDLNSGRNESGVLTEPDAEAKDTQIQSEEYIEESKENLQYDTEHYERRYGDDVYEDLMRELDVCLGYNYQFANVDDIQDARAYFSFFYAYEHHWDDTGEQYYDPVDGYYKIPGDEIRRVLTKYMDFQELDLSEVLPGKTNTNTMGDGYDAENDIYYTPILGGFGGYHPGFSSITYETLAPGVIKAVGDETTTIVVHEENDGVLKLISYM